MRKVEQVMGNLFFRPQGGPFGHLLPKGYEIVTHKHYFDHVTIVYTGAVHARVQFPDGRVIEQDVFSPGSAARRGLVGSSHKLLIAAGVTHEFKVLEDDTYIECVYAHRNPQGEVTQEYTGWNEAYGATL